MNLWLSYRQRLGKKYIGELHKVGRSEKEADSAKNRVIEEESVRVLIWQVQVGTSYLNNGIETLTLGQLALLNDRALVVLC